MSNSLPNRRVFLKKLSASLFLTGPVVSLISCSSEDEPITTGTGGSGGSGGPDCLANGTATNISSNHGHTLSVPAADIQAGTAKDYDIGGASHSHTVTISSDNFTQLKNNTSISVTSSSSSGHTHVITVSCA